MCFMQLCLIIVFSLKSSYPSASMRCLRAWICLPNKTNALLCMGMRLTSWLLLLLWQQKGRKEKTVKRVEGMWGRGESFKKRVRAGCVHKLRISNSNVCSIKEWGPLTHVETGSEWQNVESLNIVAAQVEYTENRFLSVFASHLFHCQTKGFFV